MKKRLTFGVITAECYREHTAEMMSGILAQCTLADCNVIVLSAKNNFQEPVTPHNYHEAELFRLAQAPEFDGFLYDRNSFAHQGIRKHIDDLLKRTGKPVMLLDASEVPYFENTVTHDPEAFELLVEHLIQVHGYRKIYCLTGQKAFTQSAERLEAYCNVMQRHGLYYDESYYAYGDFWRDYPVEYAQRIISGALSKPEAVVCANDVMADALIAALTKAGIRVPEDIAVTGFDGNLEDAQSDVALTTCKKSHAQLGADAVRRLYSILTGRSCRRVPADRSRIQIGRSCGCIPVRHRTAKSRREQRLLSDHKEWFYQSELMFEMMHTETLHEILSVVANRAYLICHWNQLRIFLTADYLRAARDDRSVPSRKDCCEVLWCDRAGRSSGISDRAVKQSEIIADLTQEAQHPTAYYLSPLHMNEQQFGLMALSFGKLPCCYQAEYCTFLNCLCLALEHLTLPGKRDTDREKSIENPQLFEALVPLREEMQQHPEKDWSIQVLCQHTHISRSYLQRMYKTYFGKSIFEELIDFRMQKAKALLRDTELSISEVAAACGYGSYSHFANQFKSQEGITPSGYREKCSAT